jgi:hypothetical protein
VRKASIELLRSAVTGLVCGLALVSCSRSSARKAEDAPEKVAVSFPVSLNSGAPYLDLTTNASTKIDRLLGERGAVVLVLDQQACESCLAIDVEIRAIRARNPQQPVLVITDSVNAGSVSKYLSAMKSGGRVLVVPSIDLATLTMGVGGALTTHLVDGKGRVLFSQTRLPGARQELLVEDLRALEALLANPVVQQKDSGPRRSVCKRLGAVEAGCQETGEP